MLMFRSERHPGHISISMVLLCLFLVFLMWRTVHEVREYYRKDRQEYFRWDKLLVLYFVGGLVVAALGNLLDEVLYDRAG